MSRVFSEINNKQKAFIKAQHIFFVATAANEGRVNISPKGMDSLRILDDHTVVWLNLTGSGNETAAHILKHNRITIMFCAFEGKPLILRLYGKADVYHERDDQFHEYTPLFPKMNGTRQIIVVHVDMIQESCGFAVPLMDFKEDRELLDVWAEKKGKSGIEAYHRERNVKSLDGFNTNIIENSL